MIGDVVQHCSVGRLLRTTIACLHRLRAGWELTAALTCQLGIPVRDLEPYRLLRTAAAVGWLVEIYFLENKRQCSLPRVEGFCCDGRGPLKPDSDISRLVERQARAKWTQICELSRARRHLSFGLSFGFGMFWSRAIRNARAP